MNELIEQLERVRGRARWMLLVMRGSAWLAGVIGVAIVAGWVDYLLRLPGGVRFTLLLIGLAAAGAAAFIYLGRSIRIQPTLTTLALRLERLYPIATGRLASAVAFSTRTPPPEERSPIREQLTRRATTGARGVLRPAEVDRLINPAGPRRAVLLLLAVLLVLVVFTVVAPAAVATAARRWAAPLGDAQWPRRYNVESRTDQRVAPDDAPLRVAAGVTRGDQEELRTWVVYRFVNSEGEGNSPPADWQRALMTRQRDAAETRGAGRYQRLIEPRAGASGIELYFEAGDDRTDPQSIKLIQPPELRGLLATVEPPEYAADLRPPRRHDLLVPPRPSATIDALTGSRIHLRVRVAGSLDRLSSSAGAERIHRWVARSLPGFFEDRQSDPSGGDPAPVERNLAYQVHHTAGDATGFTISWTLGRPVRFRFHLADAYGTRYEDERQFTFHPRLDRPPRATMLEPAGDASVLPAATVALAAETRDDVAVADARLIARNDGGKPIEWPADEADPRQRITLAAEFDLEPLELEPGDHVSVLAIARDNYRLGGDRHEPIESTPRLLRIISPRQMVEQLRTKLSDLRQRAVRARDAQKDLLDQPPGGNHAERQRGVAEQSKAIHRGIREIRRRIQRNRLEDERLGQTLGESDRLTESAAQSAERAAGRIARAAQANDKKTPEAKKLTQQARQSQREARERLDELVKLLDQGRDAYELQQKLVELSKDQQALSSRTRETMPRTLGQSREQLDPEQREKLDKLADDQGKLGERAKELVEKMRSTSSAIERQSKKPEDQATAEALRQAASTATQKSLNQKMSKASQQAGQNQLAQAQREQKKAEQVIERMLENVGQAERMRQRILRRRMMKLVEAIRELRDQQKAQLDRLVAAKVLDGLAGAMMTLRRNTLAVSEQARRTDGKTGPVAEMLEAAARRQAAAVEGLRAADASQPKIETAERNALAKLNEALALAQELARKAGEKANKKKRQKLIAAYRQAMERQKGIRDETRDLIEVREPERDRRWRADSIKVAGREADLRTTVEELQDKLEDTVVYQSVHEQMDGWMREAVNRLRRGHADRQVAFQQDLVVSALKSLIEALQPDNPDKPFAGGQSGGGSGGGGGAGKPPLVPPLAEVKLLRSRQSQVHTLTRRVDQQDQAEREGMLDILRRQQRSLSESGERLVETLQSRHRNGPQQVE